jgi:hypothetical protein
MWKLGLGDTYFLNKETVRSNTEVENMVEESEKSEQEQNNIYKTPGGHIFGYL